MLALNNPSNDTLSLFYDHRTQLEILRKMGKTDEVIEGYYKMLEWFAPSKEYHYLTYTIAEDIVNYYLGQQDFDKALESVQNLRLYRRNRYDIPYYQLIRAKYSSPCINWTRPDIIINRQLPLLHPISPLRLPHVYTS